MLVEGTWIYQYLFSWQIYFIFLKFYIANRFIVISICKNWFIKKVHLYRGVIKLKSNAVNQQKANSITCVDI